MTVGQIIFAIITAALTVVGFVLAGFKLMLNNAKEQGANGNRLHTLEGKIDRLKCGEHISSVNSMHVDMESLRGDIKSIMLSLGITKSGSFNGIYTANSSPMQLTTKGKEFIDKYSLDSMLYRNWDSIRNLISSKGFTTAYDIDRFCFEQALIKVECFFTDEDLVRIKDIAFSNGDKLEAYSSMIAVLVRNKYFSDNGISISDIDTLPAN
ncbi:MAG: hypothetical protein LBK47_01900 [Prevotellaceae bacterium]|jgi:hypothetical protein|nr:hypothetical protein [Prevotellaceae bacterium]